VRKVVLLYSGGLDTSCMLKWLQEKYQCQVVALTVDLGQQGDDLKKIKQKALKLGAKKALVAKAKDEFAGDYLSFGIKANACYQGDYHLSTPLGRPLLAKWAVEVANKEGAEAIAHGCTGKGNDQVRIETAALCLDPGIKVIAPVREWDMTREEEIAYAKKHKIPVPASVDFPYSVDDNMWGMTWEGGEIDHPKQAPKIEKFLTTYTLAEKAPDKAELVQLTFKQGLPVAVNGKRMKLSKLIEQLNQVGGKHGVGVAHLIEDRLVGVKNGGVYELPAAQIIIKAHKALEQYVCTRELNELKQQLDVKWAYLCYGAKWFDPVMGALNAFNDWVNQKVDGVVTMKLYKGKAEMVAMESKYGLHHVSFDKGGVEFNVNASAGFVELYGLQMKLWNSMIGGK
jgi:argininosuccinate synthase